MQGGTRIAVGVGIGYVLGRTRKMKFALSLAGAAMSRRSSGLPSELLERGSTLLRSSPELTRLTDNVRGELLGAVRSAAVTAASNRIDALNDRLQQGSPMRSDADEAERDESHDDEFDDDTADESVDEPTAEDDEFADDEDADDERAEDERAEDDEERAPAARSRASRPRTTAARKTASRSTQRRSTATDRKSAPAPRRRARTEADTAPVRRTRR